MLIDFHFSKTNSGRKKLKSDFGFETKEEMTQNGYLQQFLSLNYILVWHLRKTPSVHKKVILLNVFWFLLKKG